MFKVVATISRFEDLEEWKDARILCKQISYLILKNELFSEDFTLRNQPSGSSGSIMDNIAESFGREGNKEPIHFLSFAGGSCRGTKSQSYRTSCFGYASENDLNKTFELMEKQTAGIKAVINYLKKSDIKGNKFKEL